jgi:hypothetical protein
MLLKGRKGAMGMHPNGIMKNIPHTLTLNALYSTFNNGDIRLSL